MALSISSPWLSVTQDTESYVTGFNDKIASLVKEVMQLPKTDQIMVQGSWSLGKTPYRLNFIATDYFNAFKAFDFKSLSTEQFYAAITILNLYKDQADSFNGKSSGVATFVEISDHFLSDLTDQLGLKKAA